MLTELLGSLFNVRSDRTEIIANKPEACPYCKRMTYFFVSYHGQTRCTTCHSELKEN